MSCGTGRGGWGRRPKPKNFGFHFSWKQQHVLLSFASLWEEALNANFFCYSQSKHTTASVSTQDIFPTNISVFQCPCYAQEQLATEDFTILIFLQVKKKKNIFSKSTLWQHSSLQDFFSHTVSWGTWTYAEAILFPPITFQPLLPFCSELANALPLGGAPEATAFGNSH